MNLYKFIILVGLLTPCVWAGDKIGNGGGLWACYNSQNKLEAGMLVDLYEARTLFPFQILPVENAMAQQIAITKSQILAKVNPTITANLDKYLNEVFKKAHYIDAILEKVDDALFRFEPSEATCHGMRWQYIQFANFTPENTVLIRNDIWTSPVISELDKAALLIHEAVYRWMRVEYSDTDSLRSRQIVGFLFSNLDPDEMSKRIQTLLGPAIEPGILDSWACMLRNPNALKVFMGFGQSENEARFNSTQFCIQSTNTFFCHKEDATCEQAQTNADHWFCEVKNNNTQREFSGKGRTKTEAAYQALKSCEDGSDGGFFCRDPNCTETK